MLVGDKAKFFGIVCGLSFAALLMTQQGAIFVGVMALVYGHVSDTPQAEIWVSDPGLTDLDTNDLINERELDNVRSVTGVRWAVPLLRRIVYSRRPNNSLSPIMVMGVDDATGLGFPLESSMVAGSLDALRHDGTVVIDEHAAKTKLRVKLPDGTSRPLTIGDQMTMNGRGVEVVGLCRSTLALFLYPTAYMMRSQLSTIDTGSDRSFNFILVGADADADTDAVCAKVNEATGLIARNRRDFSQFIYEFYLYETGLAPNFAIAVILGFIVGAAIAGQTFSQYVSDNRRVFASLKAMGMRNAGLMKILLIQAFFTAMIGLGLGVGGAVCFGWLLDGTDLSFRLEPSLLAISFMAVMLISIAAALVSLRSLLRLDPALVFRS